jgi:hypothetical protein
MAPFLQNPEDTMKQLIAFLLLGGLIACSPNKKEVHNHYITPDSQKNGEVTKYYDGVINGGGGKGALCTKNGQTTLEVLDIYEGRQMHNLTYSTKLNSEEEMHNFIINKLVNHFVPSPDYDVTEYLSPHFKKTLNDLILKNMRFTKDGQRLRQTNDSHEPLVDSSCEIVQIAVYYDESTLIIDEDYWNQLSWLQRGALLMHEIIYFYARRSGEVDSVQTRKLIAFLMSDQGIKPVMGGLPDTTGQLIQCYTQAGSGSQESIRTTFYAYNHQDADFKGTVLLFSDLSQFGFFPFQMSAKLPNVDARSLPHLHLLESITISFEIQQDKYPLYQLDGIFKPLNSTDPAETNSFKMIVFQPTENNKTAEYRVFCSEYDRTTYVPYDSGKDVTSDFLDRFSGSIYKNTKNQRTIQFKENRKLVISEIEDQWHQATFETPDDMVCVDDQQNVIECECDFSRAIQCPIEISADILWVKESNEQMRQSNFICASHILRYQISEVKLMDISNLTTYEQGTCRNWFNKKQAELLSDTARELDLKDLTEESFREGHLTCTDSAEDVSSSLYTRQ